MLLILTQKYNVLLKYSLNQRIFSGVENRRIVDNSAQINSEKCSKSGQTTVDNTSQTYKCIFLYIFIPIKSV